MLKVKITVRFFGSLVCTKEKFTHSWNNVPKLIFKKLCNHNDCDHYEKRD